MMKAIVTDEMVQKDPPPSEISSQTSMFSDPSMGKLAFYDRQIKWFMRQDIEESLKERLYQDMLAKAKALYNNIKGVKPPPPPPVVKAPNVSSEKNDVEKLRDMISKASDLYNNMSKETPLTPIKNEGDFPPIKSERRESISSDDGSIAQPVTPKRASKIKATPSKLSRKKRQGSPVWTPRRPRRVNPPVYSGFKF